MTLPTRFPPLAPRLLQSHQKAAAAYEQLCALYSKNHPHLDTAFHFKSISGTSYLMAVHLDNNLTHDRQWEAAGFKDTLNENLEGYHKDYVKYSVARVFTHGDL